MQILATRRRSICITTATAKQTNPFRHAAGQWRIRRCSPTHSHARRDAASQRGQLRIRESCQGSAAAGGTVERASGRVIRGGGTIWGRGPTVKAACGRRMMVVHGRRRPAAGSRLVGQW